MLAECKIFPLACRMDQSRAPARMPAADLSSTPHLYVASVKVLIISIVLFPICEIGMYVACLLGLW